MKYAVIILALLVAAATVPAMASADDDGGEYAGMFGKTQTLVVEASGSDRTEGDEDTEFC